MRRILVLSPHIDDGILGAGGTIHYFCEEGEEVHYVAFSLSTQTIAPAVATAEVTRATHVLGIPTGNIKLYRYPTRDFPRNRQGILDNLIQLRDEIEPDLVLTPSTFDVHQDHQTVTQEAIRAFKHYMLFGYELPWNNMQFKIDGQVALAEYDIAAKISSLKYFESQKDKPYMSPEFIMGWATMRGVQRGIDYAEVFEIVRWNVK